MLCYALLTLAVVWHSNCLVLAGAILSPVPWMNSGVLITCLSRVTCDDIADREIPSLLVVNANRLTLQIVIRALSKGNTNCLPLLRLVMFVGMLACLSW